ncbi:NAD(P)H-binding protein [Paenibacillus sp. FJAT-26967]|uniref:NAD(P)H-binding protein n=1 Tax=Paenibacillus sp. FJAT-26967 TaxID=1729690 RepID=UPI0008399C27|nr:NAD(P)H-binding protein [Paenibacillus sp. FJAT-26967]
MKRTAIVAGATGLVGRELVRELLQEPSYEKIVALVRTPLHLEDARLEQITTDWSEKHLDSELGSLLKDADLYCALGTTIKKAKSKQQFRVVDYEYPMLLGRLARKYGAARLLVVSAMGADRNSRFFYSRVKGEMEEGLKKSGVGTLHLFRPSLLIGEREEFRLGEAVGAMLSKPLSFLMVGSFRKYKPISASRVARAMIAAARSQSAGVHIHESDRMAE